MLPYKRSEEHKLELSKNNPSIRFLTVVNGKAWCDNDSETKKFRLTNTPPEPLRKAVDIIAEDLGLDFPMSSADYVDKIYEDFLVKHFDSYHQYYKKYYKKLQGNLQETNKE